MCESIGRRPLWGPCPKKEKERGRRNRSSDAELQYRCRQVGRGIQIHATPPSTYTQLYCLKRAFSHFSTLSSQTNGPMYLQTDGPTNRPVLILSHQPSTKTRKKVRKISENSLERIRGHSRMLRFKNTNEGSYRRPKKSRKLELFSVHVLLQVYFMLFN